MASYSMDGEDGKEYPPLPPNYVSLAQLQERWLKKQEETKKQKEKEEEKEQKPEMAGKKTQRGGDRGRRNGHGNRRKEAEFVPKKRVEKVDQEIEGNIKEEEKRTGYDEKMGVISQENKRMKFRMKEKLRAVGDHGNEDVVATVNGYGKEKGEVWIRYKGYKDGVCGETRKKACDCDEIVPINENEREICGVTSDKGGGNERIHAVACEKGRGKMKIRYAVSDKGNGKERIYAVASDKGGGKVGIHDVVSDKGNGKERIHAVASDKAGGKERISDVVSDKGNGKERFHAVVSDNGCQKERIHDVVSDKGNGKERNHAAASDNGHRKERIGDVVSDKRNGKERIHVAASDKGCGKERSHGELQRIEEMASVYLVEVSERNEGKEEFSGVSRWTGGRRVGFRGGSSRRIYNKIGYRLKESRVSTDEATHSGMGYTSEKKDENEVLAVDSELRGKSDRDCLMKNDENERMDKIEDDVVEAEEVFEHSSASNKLEDLVLVVESERDGAKLGVRKGPRRDEKWKANLGQKLETLSLNDKKMNYVQPTIETSCADEKRYVNSKQFARRWKMKQRDGVLVWVKKGEITACATGSGSSGYEKTVGR